METTHTVHKKEHDYLADIKKFSHNASGILTAIKKGLRAAAVTKICPNDKEAMQRILSED